MGIIINNSSVVFGVKPIASIVLDPDALAFLTAAEISDPIITSAINTLVIDIKNVGIWTKMKAIYPFVGGTATTHKWNLKDPRDLNIAFRLTFNGGWVHSSNGVLSNGTNSFADTFLNRSVFANVNLGCQGVYITPQTGTDIRYECGIASTNQFFTMRSDDLSGNNNWFNGSTTPKSSSAVLRNGGFTASSRIATNDYKTIIQDGTILSNTNNDNAQYNTNNFYLGRANTASGTSNRQFRFYFIGNPLISEELTNLRTAVVNFQTTLGRNI